MTRAELAGELELDRKTYDEIVAHARGDFPFEACGLLAGQGGRVVKHFVVPNDARSMTFYSMEPKALLRAMTAWCAVDCRRGRNRRRQIPERPLRVLVVSKRVSGARVHACSYWPTGLR